MNIDGPKYDTFCALEMKHNKLYIAQHNRLVI
jgi:hypothetical protein